MELQSIVVAIVAAFYLTTPMTPAAAQQPAPIIDMHLHAYPADAQGPPPVVVCAPYDTMPSRDPRVSDGQYAADTFKAAHCRHPIWSAKTDDELRARSLAMLARYNITAVTGGPLLDAWRGPGGKRIIPSLEFGMADAPKPDHIRERRLAAATQALPGR